MNTNGINDENTEKPSSASDGASTPSAVSPVLEKQSRITLVAGDQPDKSDSHSDKIDDQRNAKSKPQNEPVSQLETEGAGIQSDAEAHSSRGTHSTSGTHSTAGIQSDAEAHSGAGTQSDSAAQSASSGHSDLRSVQDPEAHNKGEADDATSCAASAPLAEVKEKQPSQRQSILAMLEPPEPISSILKGIAYVGAPLTLLVAICFFPKLAILWIVAIVLKPTLEWIYRKLPKSTQEKIRRSLPDGLQKSKFVREYSDGAEQGLPFVLFFMYLFCLPFAMIWISVHWCKDLFASRRSNGASKEETANQKFVFVQNRNLHPVHSETNFYYSKAFGIVFFAFFALGIPAFSSYAIYERLGIENLMGDPKQAVCQTLGRMPEVRCQTDIFSNPKQEKREAAKIPARAADEQAVAKRPVKGEEQAAPEKTHFTGTQIKIIRSMADERSNQFQEDGLQLTDEATALIGYNGYWPWIRDHKAEPNKDSVFLVHFYLVSLSSAICLLFFKSWFTFPLNFLSTEHDIEIAESGIRRKSLKSWFRNVVTMNGWSTGNGPDKFEWHEVKGLRRLEEGFTKLCPLPETAFKKESLTYKILNKCAAFVDGLSNQSNKGNYLVFSATEAGNDFGNNIKINLNDLNREQRAKLFYAVRKWAPHVQVSTTAEEQLLGSTVLRQAKYTQLWFDMLTSKPRSAKRQHALSQADSLKNGEYKIEERISSGGQATAYIARKNSSEESVVLKEFILSTAASTGAILESAREFEAEVSLLSQLNHQGVVRLEDYFFEDGRVYVVLEYIEGKSLRQLVQEEGALEEARVITIAESICDVLTYLHNNTPAIVHRDITPENILISPDGKIKIIDFSLAVRKDGERPTESCAKQCYTPPEQFREEVCTQSDIYALGATMYFMLTGLSPKPISSSAPKEKNDKISDELNEIVQHATEPEITNRYESAEWLKLDLEKLVKDEASP